jgi:hypothetical protein
VAVGRSFHELQTASRASCVAQANSDRRREEANRRRVLRTFREVFEYPLFSSSVSHDFKIGMIPKAREVQLKPKVR